MTRRQLSGVIARRLRALVEERGITEREFTESLGVVASCWGHWQGKTLPNALALRRIAEAYEDVSVDWLLGLED